MPISVRISPRANIWKPVACPTIRLPAPRKRYRTQSTSLGSMMSQRAAEANPVNGVIKAAILRIAAISMPLSCASTLSNWVCICQPNTTNDKMAQIGTYFTLSDASLPPRFFGVAASTLGSLKSRSITNATAEMVSTQQAIAAPMAPYLLKIVTAKALA